MASVLVNGSPTAEFQFHCGLEKGDPLAIYLFILVAESLYLSFSRVVDAGIFKGIKIDNSTMISHLFYVDDAVFVGEWSDDNLSSIMHVLHCFSLASGLKINVKKSHLLGVGIPNDLIVAAACTLGHSIMKTPFKCLGVTVGAIHGPNIQKLSSFTSSIWNKILKEVNILKDRGVDLISHCKRRVGNGMHTRFWSDVWLGDQQLRYMFPRIYALEENKESSVAVKLQGDVEFSLLRQVRGGVEAQQLVQLQDLIRSSVLVNAEDRWFWDLNGNGVFCVKDVRKLLDESFLPKEATATRWFGLLLVLTPNGYRGSIPSVKKGDEVGNHGEDSDVDEVLKTMFDESSGQKKKQSGDPFGIYPMLDKQRKVNSHGDTVNGESLKYPPGFTPIDETKMLEHSTENVEKQNEDRDQNNNMEEPLNGRDECSDNMGTKPDDLDSGCSGRFKKSVAPGSGGSILCLMEEVVKVGQTMGEVMMMGDFNEVRFKSDRFGSFFNERGADMFNSFISNASLEEVPLGGCAYTWCHKSASNMSKLVRVAPVDQSNGIGNMLFKLKLLKSKIKEWINVFKNNSKAELIRLKGELQAVDGDIDNGNGSDEVAKIKWSVEGDENSSFFHGMLIKNHSQLSIRGVMADGVWIENPDLVKDEFVQHFSSRFGKPIDIRASIDMNFPKILSSVQKEELEYDVSKEELKRAVWDCGCNSSFIALIPKTPGANMTLACIRLKLGNEDSSSFWEDKWFSSGVIKELFPRLYALERHKHATVHMKLMATSLDNSFRWRVRSGAEES
nr:RNA-directed DNA polymerase, eukaryota [Tanacetum cinerariifolium]